MSWLFVVRVALMPSASAVTDTSNETGAEGDADTDTDTDTDAHTSDTDTDTDATTADSWETGRTDCETCEGAAGDVGEHGGNPCDQGCSTGGRTPVVPLVLALLAAVAVRRRR